MKRSLQWLYKTLILATGVMLFACNDSTEQPTPEPTDFPSFDDMTVLVGDDGTLKFNAGSTWTISADKLWFKLSQQTGVAGAQEVGYQITDGGIGFQDQTAVITFAMAGRKASFKATRIGNERALTMVTYESTDMGLEPKDTEQIDLVYSENANSYQANFGVRANFDWKVTFPEWVLVDPDKVSGGANPDEVAPPYAWVTIDYSKAQAEDMQGEIVFSDLNANAEPIVKTVTAPGSKKYMISNASRLLTFNAEGLYNPSSIGGGTTEPTDGYTFSAITGIDGVVFFRLAYDGQWYGIVDDWGNINYVANWVNIFKDGADELGEYVEEGDYWMGCRYNDSDKRYAVILALPAAMAEGLTEQDLITSSEDEIKAEYQPYIISEVTQEAISGGLEFSMGAPEGITLEKMPEGDERDGIQSEYGTELIYVMTFNSFANASMAMIDYKGYNGEYEMVPIYAPAENEMSQPNGWISFMAGIGQYMTVDISDQKAPFTGSRSTLVVARNSGTYMNEFVIKVVQNVARD